MPCRRTLDSEMSCLEFGGGEPGGTAELTDRLEINCKLALSITTRAAIGHWSEVNV